MAGIINPELILQFEKSAAAAAASVIRIPHNLARVAELTEQLTAEDEYVLLAGLDNIGPEYTEEIIKAGTKTGKYVLSPDKIQLSSTRTGITGAFCGIASTGSVCVPVSEKLTCIYGMLTRSHIVVLDGADIIPRPSCLFSDDYLGGRGLRGSYSIITGPSATADMGPLVRGVHGPGKVQIIILE